MGSSALRQRFEVKTKSGKIVLKVSEPDKALPPLLLPTQATIAALS